MAAADAPFASRRIPWLRHTLVTLAILLALGLGGAISLSRPFQRGTTRLFSKVVDGVKDHPRATVAISLGGVALLWLSIAAVVAGQELRTHRDRMQKRQ
jgi:hypothetical protein